MGVARQVKVMTTDELNLALSRMVEKVKGIKAMLDEPMLEEDREILVEKMRRLRIKYTYVENELDSRKIILKQRVTEIVDLVVGM